MNNNRFYKMIINLSENTDKSLQSVAIKEVTQISHRNAKNKIHNKRRTKDLYVREEVT